MGAARSSIEQSMSHREQGGSGGAQSREERGRQGEKLISKNDLRDASLACTHPI
jgi:hypothetical protein